MSHPADSARRADAGASLRAPASAAPRSWLPALGAVLAAAAPLVVLVVLVWRDHVDVPQWDQWRFPDLLASFEHGELTLRDLAAQHNEHRILFPRLIVLGLASLSRWNISLELAANLVLACALFAVAAWETARRTESLGRGITAALVVLDSLLVFSLTQWENWLWGMEMAVFLNALAVVAAFAALAAPDARRIDATRLGAAIAAGVVATYSFANGLLVWPIGAAVIGFAARRARAALAAWLAAGAAVFLAYFRGYETPAHTVPWTLLQKPVKHLGYALSYLGAPVAYFDRFASQLAGAAGLLALGYAAWRLGRSLASRSSLLFYGALAGYAVASAAITAVGRIEISGPGSSMTSRYITFGNLLWLAVVALLSLAAFGDSRGSRSDRRAEPVVAAALLALLAGCLVASSVAAEPWFARQYEKLAPARAALLASEPERVPDEVLLRLCWSPELVRDGLAKLKQNHLWIYSEERP
jgi:hypothetical protein